jgi:hypothetical protein
MDSEVIERVIFVIFTFSYIYIYIFHKLLAYYVCIMQLPKGCCLFV